MLVVAVAMIDAAGHVLVQQRPPGRAHAGLWEFPGGKVEPGEAPEAALVREIDEELGLAIQAGALHPLGFATDDALVLLLYRYDLVIAPPQPLDGQTLRWERAEVLRELPMPPADRPLVELLIRAMQD